MSIVRAFERHPYRLNAPQIIPMLTFQTTRVLELKILPMHLPDKQVLRYTMLVELTAEEYDKIAQELKPNGSEEPHT